MDFNQTQVVDSKFVSIAAWYDNEIGYSNRVLDLVDYMMAEEEEEKNKSKPPKQQWRWPVKIFSKALLTNFRKLNKNQQNLIF